MPEHTVELDVRPGMALEAVRQAAGDWGAEFQPEGSGGRLRLPVVHGLRRGLVTGTVTVVPDAVGSRVTFRPEEDVFHVHAQAVVVLLFAAIGSLMTVIWPFFPELLPLAPFGALLALGGWFLVISRLRSSGPDEFLAAVAMRPPEAGNQSS